MLEYILLGGLVAALAGVFTPAMPIAFATAAPWSYVLRLALLAAVAGALTGLLAGALRAGQRAAWVCAAVAGWCFAASLQYFAGLPTNAAPSNVPGLTPALPPLEQQATLPPLGPIYFWPVVIGLGVGLGLVLIWKNEQRRQRQTG